MNKERKQEVISVIWKALEAVGMLTVAFMAPNAVQLLKGRNNLGEYPRRQVRVALRRLEKKGYIRSLGEKNAWKFELTKEGREQLEKKTIEAIVIPKPVKWDGKWRMVIFDIPEKYRQARDGLRGKLEHIGFQYLNLSVWVHPFECRNEINAIVEYYGVGKYVRYAIVDLFDGMDVMERKFGKAFER